MRNCTADEYELFVSNIPYMIEDKIKKIEAVDVQDDYFSPGDKQIRIMYKGVPNADEIIRDGRLRLEKCHGSGYYGKGIYCADDVTYAKQYGSNILVLEVVDDFAEFLTSVKKDGFDENQYAEFIRNATENHIGYYASDFGADQHENEYVITDEDAVVIRGMIQF